MSNVLEYFIVVLAAAFVVFLLVFVRVKIGWLHLSIVVGKWQLVVFDVRKQ